MYKDRLAEWGFRKNLKKDTVKRIMRETQRREGRETEIRVRGTVVPLNRIRKKYDRQFPDGESTTTGQWSYLTKTMLIL